jgi:pimeloyl-ACP methyl ester carboxylesterase
MTARILLVLAGESSFNERYETDGYGAELRGCITDLEEVILNDTGHMVHLEQPDGLAAILEQFLTR